MHTNKTQKKKKNTHVKAPTGIFSRVTFLCNKAVMYFWLLKRKKVTFCSDYENLFFSFVNYFMWLPPFGVDLFCLQQV